MMPKSRVRLRFFTEGEPTVDIQAIVESNDCPLFVQEPEATISLICHQPDFYDPVPVILGGSSTANMTESLINYNGSVETGIRFTLNVDRPLTEFTIFHRPADDSLRSMEFSTPLMAGDVLVISTISGSKGAVVMREGTDESVLYGISPYANYINMYPGPNYIRVYAEGAPVPFTIEYTDKYGGL